MHLRGRTRLLALVAFVAAAFAMPARTTTIGVATVPALCAHDLSAQPGPAEAEDCAPLKESVLVSSGPIAGHGALNAPERQGLADMSPRSVLPTARRLLLNLLADGAARPRRSDVALFRVDLGRLRSGLPAMGPIPLGMPVMNVAAPVAGIDASDFVFPGEAAARVLLWRRPGRVAEWTGIWGSVMVPFLPDNRPEPAANRLAPIKPLFTRVRSPLNLPTIPPPRRLPLSGIPSAGGGGLPAVPAPVPLPPAWGGLGAALVLVAALRLGRRPAGRR